MKIVYKPALALISLFTAFCIAAPAQGPSLAEMARQSRAKKQQEPKGGKVFTNEDIPSPTISPAPPAAQPAEGALAGETAPAAAPAAPGEKSPEVIEKEYREKFAQLKQNQELEERRLDVMQRELNLAQQQHYSDPNVALREQYGREEINKRTADLEIQKAAVEKAKQAIADLENELRSKNLPPGWAR
ncbi:MAG: hypothetical protein HY316_08590 [Acidobacteria bacterium]|nr:hypothetical protein [Acidobacteriota bacterium]